MASVPFTLPPDYWRTFFLDKKDLEFLSTYLFENETPLTEKELVPVLIDERIRNEREALAKQQRSIGKVYLPEGHYKVGESLVFPALDWKKGKVASLRPGVNPALGEFEVMDKARAGKVGQKTTMAVPSVNSPMPRSMPNLRPRRSATVAANGPTLPTRLRAVRA